MNQHSVRERSDEFFQRVVSTSHMKHAAIVGKPAFGAWPESVSQFQQTAAGEELAGICRIDVDGKTWCRRAHLFSSTSCDGLALADQSAARRSDSRYARPQRPNLRCSRPNLCGTVLATVQSDSGVAAGSNTSSAGKCGRARPWCAAIRCSTSSRSSSVSPSSPALGS